MHDGECKWWNECAEASINLIHPRDTGLLHSQGGTGVLLFQGGVCYPSTPPPGPLKKNFFFAASLMEEKKYFNRDCLILMYSANDNTQKYNINPENTLF